MSWKSQPIIILGDKLHTKFQGIFNMWVTHWKHSKHSEDILVLKYYFQMWFQMHFKKCSVVI